MCLYDLMRSCQVPHHCSPLLNSGPDKESINVWCRIKRVGAPEYNQPINQSHNIIFTNSDVYHCSVFIHTPVPVLGKYEVQFPGIVVNRHGIVMSYFGV